MPVHSVAGYQILVHSIHTETCGSIGLEMAKMASMHCARLVKPNMSESAKSRIFACEFPPQAGNHCDLPAPLK